MTRLGIYSGHMVVRVFQNAGRSVSRRRGSHTIMEKAGHEATLSVPIHKGKDVKRGTLRDLIKDAGMTVEGYLLRLASAILTLYNFNRFLLKTGYGISLKPEKISFCDYCSITMGEE